MNTKTSTEVNAEAPTVVRTYMYALLPGETLPRIADMWGAAEVTDPTTNRARLAKVEAFWASMAPCDTLLWTALVYSDDEVDVIRVKVTHRRPCFTARNGDVAKDKVPGMRSWDRAVEADRTAPRTYADYIARAEQLAAV